MKSCIAIPALACVQLLSGATFELDCRSADAIRFESKLSVGDKLALALPDDERFDIELVESSPSKIGGETFLGKVGGANGLLTATVVKGKRGLKINFTSPTGGFNYDVRAGARGTRVRKVNPADCVRTPLPSRVPVRKNSPVRKQMSVRREQNANPVTVDVLVAYDNGAGDWLASEDEDAETFAESAVGRMNAALANTGLNSSFRFRLVGVCPVDARSINFNVVLDAVTEGRGAWESVSSMRDEVGADIVTTLIDTGSAYGTTGLGWSLQDDDNSGDYSWFSESAYNVCAVRSVAVSHTMTHEVGHNMGAGHSDRQSVQPGPQLFSYSSGSYFTANGNNYHTIMAYDSDGRSAVSYSEVPYFSSPLHSYEGTAVGDDSHDNTRTLKNTFEQVAAFREARDEPVVDPDPEPVALTWHTTKAEAFAAAESSGRRILLVYGRDTCGNTTATRDYTCEDAAVKAKLLEGYVLWYSNCDTQSSESSRYLVNFEGTLPGVSVIDPASDTAIAGAGGYLNVSAMLSLLEGAENADPGLTDYTEREAVVGDFKYTYWLERGKAVVVFVENAPGRAATTLSIPATLGGYAVAKIGSLYGSSIMSDDLSVVDVNLPGSLKIIEHQAFVCYHKLSRVNLNEGLESIGHNAFWSTAVSKLHIPASVTNISECALKGTFYDGGYAPVTIDSGNPNYVVVDGCVYDVDRKFLLFCPPTHDSIEIPDSVEIIGDSAFFDCDMRELSFGPNVREIRESRMGGRGPMISDYELERIYVSEDNPNYSSVNGVLYNKDKTKLVFCPLAAVELTVPASCVELESWLLCYNSSMERYVVEPGNPAYDSYDGCLYDKGCLNLLAIAKAKKGNLALPATMVGPSDLSDFVRNACFDTVTVGAGNTVFEAQDGSLYDKGRRNLIFASRLVSEFNVGAPVESIGAYAFGCHTNLTKVACANTVKSIGTMAFECSGLRQIDLGQGVEVIEDSAFDACRLNAIVLPASLRRFAGTRPFFRCFALRKVCFCGNAPELYDVNGLYYMFDETSADLRVHVLPGTTGWDGNPGSSVLPSEWPVGDIDSRPLATWNGDSNPPPNDNFANAAELTGISGSVVAKNVFATQEDGEPFESAYTKTSVWWKWTAPSSGTVTFDTIGTTFDTIMGIYEGDSLRTLKVVAHDGGGGRASKCTFSCKGGVTYSISIEGRDYSSGDICLRWSEGGGVTPLEPAILPEPKPIADMGDPKSVAADLIPVKAEEVTAALAYNGYLAKSGEVVGSVTVKVAKKGKVTATVQLPDSSGSKALKKFSYAGTLKADGSVGLDCRKNNGEMTVAIGAKALTGKVKQGGETYVINGRLGTKEALSSVDALLDKKVWTVALPTPTNGVPHALMNGYSVLSVTGAKKGKVKVTGFLADGTKVSVTAQGTVFDSCVIVPVNATLYKGKAGGFSLKLKIEGEKKIEVGNVSDWTAVVDGRTVAVKWDAVYASAKADIGSGATFGMDAAAIPFDDVRLASADGTPTLPRGVKVDSVGGKWTLPKAGKVAFTKDKRDLDVSKFGENPAGLKLTFKKKTGLFSGSFQLYQQSGDKLRKLKATVNGAVVDGVGYGSATVKNMGALPVTVGK